MGGGSRRGRPVENRASNFFLKMGLYFSVFLAVGRNMLRVACSFQCKSEVEIQRRVELFLRKIRDFTFGFCWL